MKVINLKRGQGKTTRLLYASEFDEIPILCETRETKKFLLDTAFQLGLTIPEPITVNDLISNKSTMHYSDILIDEAPHVLQCLLRNLGVVDDIRAITLTSDKI